MFEFTRNFYEASGNGGGSESIGPGTVIIPEQEIVPFASADIMFFVTWPDPIPSKLAITFDGNEYILTVVEDEPNRTYYYGEKELSEEFTPSYNTYPFALLVKRKSGYDGLYWLCTLYAQNRNEVTHTISAKIPEEKSPKVLSFPKGRTIVSELSRLNKAFGTVSKKKTIIGQLSDIADAAEAGKIGGGSGALIVNGTYNIEDSSVTLDKTWQEIYDAMANNTLAWTKASFTGPNNSTVSFSPVLSAQSLKKLPEMGGEMVYSVNIMMANGSDPAIAGFTCNSPDGYPVFEEA